MQDGVSRRVNVRAVIGNAGPTATVALAFGAACVDQVTTGPKPAANLVINFATRDRIVDAPGLVTFGKARRLCNLGELTAT